MGSTAEDWAVFWCTLLSPVLLGEIPERERERYFRELSRQTHRRPDGRCQRVSVRTLRRKWRQFQEAGVKGLFRQQRKDRGHSRHNRAAMLARAVELKREQPYRSDEAINRLLRAEFGRTIPRSTLYRHLKQAGATRLRMDVSSKPVRCRWTRDKPGALWVGDFEHGPIVMRQQRAIKTHLSAWIDCHSRFVVEARYYVRENLDVLIDSLLRAWGSHGASRELYVDNAKIYRARALQLACTQLQIKLLHRPPQDPPAGGLIERFFQTVQAQFEAEVRAAALLTLEQLNEFFSAWLHVVYHQRIHAETKQTPHERYHQEPRLVRSVNLSDVLSLFHRRELRTVHTDFSDVQIHNQFFAVDRRLRGEKVVVHYDPFSSGEEVLLYSRQGLYLGRGRRYQRERGSHPPRPDAAPRSPIPLSYLEHLRDEHRTARQREREQGIDYHSARQRSVWSRTQFLKSFARLLGRPGGVSGLEADEIETLTLFHARHDRVTESLLKQALEQAETPTIPCVLFHLQQRLDERSA